MTMIGLIRVAGRNYSTDNLRDDDDPSASGQTSFIDIRTGTMDSRDFHQLPDDLFGLRRWLRS
jgi:hypothetical protein